MEQVKVGWVANGVDGKAVICLQGGAMVVEGGWQITGGNWAEEEGGR